MDILADQYLYKLNEFLPKACSLTLYDPEEGFPDDAPQFDAFLVRTVTAINKRTLPDTERLQFIGSATAGTDHIDTDYLERCGIEFAHSAGCNSRAVAEYVITALYRWGEQKGTDPEKLKVGVVGCGNAGSALIGLLDKLNIERVMYDPPKEEREDTFQSASVDELLSSDVLSFHTPLVQSGTYATRHLCSAGWLDKKFKLIINTARGGVVDERALFSAMEHDFVDDAVLDVWENEPVFSDQMAQKSLIATPHIAGYSRQAKWRASEIVVRQLCNHFDLDYSEPDMNDRLKRKQAEQIKEHSFSGFLWKNNNIEFYDRKLREMIGLPDREKASNFAKLRSQTETRFEYQSLLKQADAGGLEYPEKAEVFND